MRIQDSGGGRVCCVLPTGAGVDRRRDEILAELGLRAEVGAQPGNDNASKNEGEKFSPSFRTTAAIAAEVGLSERSAQQRKQAANLPEPVRDALRATSPRQCAGRCGSEWRRGTPNTRERVCPAICRPRHARSWPTWPDTRPWPDCRGNGAGGGRRPCCWRGWRGECWATPEAHHGGAICPPTRRTGDLRKRGLTRRLLGFPGDQTDASRGR